MSKMNSNCADIGVIQAFIDGELSSAESADLTHHFALCSACAEAFADAEQQAEMVFAAMGREIDPLVPSQRLWTKINDVIEKERANVSIWSQVRSFFAFPFASPSLSAAMALLVVAGLAAVLFTDRNGTAVSSTSDLTAASNMVVAADPAPASREIPTGVVAENTAQPDIPIRVPAAANEPQGYRVVRADMRPAAERRVQTMRPANPAAAEFSVSGEETYVKAIAELSRSVGGSASNLMRPNELIAYERNLATVDQSISQLRNELRRDPKNETAKQMLYSSYRNKIDLLNSVSQREELVASIR